MRNLIVVSVLALSSWAFCQAPPAPPPAVDGPRPAPSKVVEVTVFQGTALVTREVAVPEGVGPLELVVSPLPPQTIDSSLYTEGSSSIRVLTTRYRTRAVREDTREEVRAREARIRALRADLAKLERENAVINQNLSLLEKLESFTAATMQSLAEKGMLNAQATMELTKFIMEDRSTRATRQVEIQQLVQQTNEQIAFVERELREIAAGSSRNERDAVIVLEKTENATGTVRLNYLVNAAGWQPTYRLRAAGERDPVQLEYLASVEQQTGEDWRDVTLILSNAQPMLNASPPSLLALNVTVMAATAGGPATPNVSGQQAVANVGQAKQMRAEAQRELNRRNLDVGAFGLNEAAALEQTNELLAREEDLREARSAAMEGPSVTYRLKTRFSLPSRGDSQLVEIAKLELPGDFYYKAVPVLSPHVYRLATLVNRSEQVLLPGEATMYLGSDFVGRMSLPLVVVGESFTAGFGVDPQLQVERALVSRSQAIQGGNQVHTYDYRIRVSSFKPAAVRLQLWDRLPLSEGNSVGISLLKVDPALSNDATYLRVERPKNLLRWDLVIEPNTNGEKAANVTYSFRLEYDKSVSIGNFKATR